jgi:hypothetical protein
MFPMEIGVITTITITTLATKAAAAEAVRELLFSFGGSLTLILLVISLGIFSWLTAKSKSVRSFQFQISLFIIIWIMGEIIDILQEEGVLPELKLLQQPPFQPSSDGLGIYIHVSAMAMFSAMLWARFYLSIRSGKKLSDSLQDK